MQNVREWCIVCAEKPLWLASAVCWLMMLHCGISLLNLCTWMGACRNVPSPHSEAVPSIRLWSNFTEVEITERGTCLYLSRWWRSRTLFMSLLTSGLVMQQTNEQLYDSRSFLCDFYRQAPPWLTATLELDTQKCWNLLFNVTIGEAWLQRDTVLPQQSVSTPVPGCMDLPSSSARASGGS